MRFGKKSRLLRRLPLLLRACALCCTATIRTVSIDATGAHCAVRGWGVLFGVRAARSYDQKTRALPTTTFANLLRLQQNKQHTDQQRQQQSVKHTTLLSTLQLHPANPLPHMAT